MTRFNEFWDAYPKGRRSNKKGCQTKWNAKKLDDKADVILDDIRWRTKYDKKWLDGFIPMPSTYINQERWDDDRQDVRERVKASSATPGVMLPEVRRAVMGCILKGYSEEAIARNFNITPQELWDLRKEVKGIEGRQDETHQAPS